MLESSEAGRVAVVVGHHDGGVERLEIEHDDRTAVEARAGLEYERHALRRALPGPLMDVGTEGDVVATATVTQHHGLDLELRAAEERLVEEDPVDSRELARSSRYLAAARPRFN